MREKQLFYKIIATSKFNLPFYTEIQAFKTVAALQKAARELKKTIDKKQNRDVVHFGMNSRLKDGTPATKPAARELFGGQQLTISLTEAAQQKFKCKSKEMVRDVRKVKNSEVSCLVLEYCRQTNMRIFFHLNLINERMINAILQQDTSFQVGSFNPVTDSVTAQELHYIYKHWSGENGFNRCTVFFRNFEHVQEPWVKNTEFPLTV